MKHYYFILIALLFLPFIGATQTLIPHLGKTAYGFCTLDGNVKIKPKYTEVTLFDTTGFANVREDSLWFLIDKEGNEYRSLKSKEKLMVFPLKNVQKKYDPWQENGQSISYLTQLYRIIKKDADWNHFWLLSKKDKSIIGFFLKKKIENDYVTFGYYGLTKKEEPCFYKNFLITLNEDSKQSLYDTLGNVLINNVDYIKIFSNKLVYYEEKNKSNVFDTYIKQNLKIDYSSIQNTLNDTCFLVSNQKIILYESSPLHLDTIDTIKIITQNNQLLFSDTLHILKAISPKHYLAYQNESASFLIKIENGKTTVKKYDYIRQLNDNILAIKNENKKTKLIDYDENLIFDSPYEDISLQGTFSHEQKYYTFQRGNIAGIMDLNFKVEFEYEADGIEKTDLPDYYLFEKGDSTGVVRRDGKIIIPAEYAEINVLFRTDFFTIRVGSRYQQDGKNMGLFTKDGRKILDPIYEDIKKYDYKGKVYFSAVIQGKTQIFDENGAFFCTVEKKNWYGISDVPLQIDHLSYSPDSSACYDRFGRFLNKENYLLYQQKLINQSDSNRFYLVEFNRQNYKLLDDEGNNLLNDNQKITQWIVTPRDSFYGVFLVEENGKSGVMNTKKEMILPFDNQSIIEITKYYIIVEKDKKTNLYTHKGVLINRESYATIEPHQYGKLRYVTRELPQTICQDSIYNYTTKKYEVFNVNCKEYGFINQFGALVIPFIYHSVKSNNKHYISTTKGIVKGKKSSFILDPTGKIVLKTKYDELEMITGNYYDQHPDQNPYFIARKADKFGLIDLKGKTIIPTKYDQLSSYWSKVLFRVKQQNQNFIINIREEFIVNENDLLETNLTEIDFGGGVGSYWTMEPTNIIWIKLKDKSLVVNKQGAITNRIDATKIQHYLNQYLNYDYRPTNRKDELKLLHIQNENKVWYYNFETYKEYKEK